MFSVSTDTPRRIYFLHTFTWLLNVFGVFFILSAHEHYSIDVFIAFYITSRLFMYYHTLANNQVVSERVAGWSGVPDVVGSILGRVQLCQLCVTS